MKYKVASILSLLCVWFIGALLVQREVILPMPNDVFVRMGTLLLETKFLEATFYTCLRVCISFFIALFMGGSLGIAAGLCKPLKLYLEPVFSILQSIPQVVYILILIVWCSGTTAIIVMIFIMIFPNFYHNSLQGMIDIDSDLNNVIHSYPFRGSYLIPKVYIPMIKTNVYSAIQVCLPLSFKVGIMGEVFIQSEKGLGSLIYYFRTSIDMVSIFACVGWMIVLVLCFSYIPKLWFKNKI